MKKLWFKSVFIFIIILSFSCSKSQDLVQLLSSTENTDSREKPKRDTLKINTKAEEALEFCKKNKFNTDFAIFIDMSLHSGVKRFFVYDFNTKKVTQEYLVGHGCGSNNWSGDDSKENPKFSNQDGIHLSSLGKYKIGERGASEWGVKTKYLMHGLEQTNSNALKRFIVFHSWERMSDEEVFPNGSPEGWGCPTISNNAFLKIDPMLKSSKRPVLMWIFQ